MVRNGELWDLGDPELNDRGLPVIHNIAKKLGCIRPSQDLKCVFPEDAEAIAELQSHMSFVNGDRDQEAWKELSGDPNLSPHSGLCRASSSESKHPTISKADSQILQAPQQQGFPAQQFQSSSQLQEPQSGDEALYLNGFKQGSQFSIQMGTELDSRSDVSPVRSDFEAQSPVDLSFFQDYGPFYPWSDFGTSNISSSTDSIALEPLWKS